MAIITGTDGNDRYNDPAYPGNVELKGTNLADQMYGLAGNDELVGFDGDDLLGVAWSGLVWSVKAVTDRAGGGVFALPPIPPHLHASSQPSSASTDAGV